MAPGPLVVLDVVAERKNSCPWRESNLGCPFHSLVPVLDELSRLTVS